MRSTKARTLNGGVTIVARASNMNVPKRPSASTTPLAQRPRASNGTSGRAGGRSAMHDAAIHSQRPQRKVLGIEVVLEHEDARESRPVPERVLPRALGLLRPQQMGDAPLDRGR